MPIPQNAQQIYSYLTGAGLNANAAAGILGNIEQESGGSPSAGVWPGNYGLIQWTPANNYFSSPPTMAQQLAGIISYIRANGSIGAINAAATSPEAAALYFSTNYERPNAALANNANRMQSAAAVAAAAASGKWPSGTGGTGGGGGGGSGGGGGGGGGPSSATLAGGYAADIQPISQDIQTASFLGDIFTRVLNPFTELWGAEKDIAGFLSQPWVGLVETFKLLTTSISALVGGFKTIIHDVLWLFNPSHWVRIFCFVFGLFVAIPAAYALMHTGQGDMYLAMGIALATLAGALLFLAFHNLPFDPTPGAPASSKNVISFQALLAYISEGIRTGTAPTGANLDALYTLIGQGGDGGGGGGGGGGAPPGIQLRAKFSPDSGSSGNPSGSGGTFTPVGNATGIFPTLTPSGIIPAGAALPGGTGGPIPGRTYPSGF